MSMRDLALVERLGELRAAGVATVKIEGRLKSAAWVLSAVTLYRSALDRSGAPDEAHRSAWRAQTEQLGRYAGRSSGEGYLDGDFSRLTGVAARPAGHASASTPPEEAAAEEPMTFSEWTAREGTETTAPTRAATSETPLPTIALTVKGARGITAVLAFGAEAETLRLPRTVVKRPEKAIRAGDWRDAVAARPPEPFRAAEVTVDDGDFLLPPKNFNALDDWLSRAARRLTKRATADAASPPAGSDAPPPLPAEVRSALSERRPHPDNRRGLSGRIDRVRLTPEQVSAGLAWLPRDVRVVVDGALDGAPEAPAIHDEALWERLGAGLTSRTAVWAMPPVLFEADLPAARAMIRWARARGDAVEANTWGVGLVCAEEGALYEAGPGLGVLNGLASRYWHENGARAAAAAVEADRRKLAELCAGASGRLVAWRYGRPLLAISRAETAGTEWEDRRGIRLMARRTRGLTEFRAREPYVWPQDGGADLRVWEVGVDLCGAPEPAAEWRGHGSSAGKFAFNWERGLY